MGFIPTSSSKQKSSKRRLVNASVLDEGRAHSGVRNLKSDQKSQASSTKGRRRPSRKDFKIVRGAAREGALYDPAENMDEITAAEKEAPEKNKRARVQASTKEARQKTKEDKKRARTKAKANKMFNAFYDDSKSSGAASSDGGSAPRAALYKGEMGSSQKRSAKLQDQASPASYKAKRGFSAVTLSSRAIRAAVCVAVAAFCVVSLYGPAQQYYQQMRETDRLLAEYEAVAAHSNDLQEQIDLLGTGAGIEDKAHEDLGYIKSGEQTAKVRGITFEEVRDFSPNVVPNSIPAPDTWYSPVLDVIFGYSS